MKTTQPFVKTAAAALLLSALQVSTDVSAFSVAPKHFAADLANGCATAATCAALAFGPGPAVAATATAPPASSTAVKVDIHAPYLLDLVKTPEARQDTTDRVVFLADSVKNWLGPAVSIELPTDLAGVAKKAVAGGASVQINGQDVGVQVVSSTKGALTIQLSTDLLPALPFAGLKSTPAIVTTAANAVAGMTPAVVNVVTKVAAVTSNVQQPFWNRPVFDGSVRLDIDALKLHRAITPKDIVGGGSAALGAAYASSFAFYNYAIAQEEKAAVERKEAMAAKRAAAADKKAPAPATAEPVANQKETASEETTTKQVEEAATPSTKGRFMKALTRK